MRRVKRLLKILLFVVLVPPALLFLVATIQVLREGSPTAPQVTEAPLYTFVPTEAPTKAPAAKPTAATTKAPTAKPTVAPTKAPTAKPTAVPTKAPTARPTTAPTKAPTEKPTAVPTAAPTERPTQVPTAVPTQAPTAAPTKAPEPSITTPYVGNANSMKFHYAGCASVKKMNASNRVPLSSRDEAISRGFEPCKNCNP